SRRRHTRFSRDWSSDVCSSDLHKVDLLICDELGFVPFDRAGGELLFNLLADRYERRSTMVTTNLTFSEWVDIFHDEKMTTALLDRLSHHAHILTPQGISYRTKTRREERQGLLKTCSTLMPTSCSTSHSGDAQLSVQLWPPQLH